MTWGNNELFRSAGQTWTYGSKPKVSKVGWNSETPPRCWRVTNHQCGGANFSTWREAMDYALSRPVMMNGYDERHEDNVFLAKHGLEMI